MNMLLAQQGKTTWVTPDRQPIARIVHDGLETGGSRAIGFSTSSIHRFDETHLDSIPKYLHAYVDYEAFKTDIFITDYFSIEFQGRCHVFRWD